MFLTQCFIKDLNYIYILDNYLQICKVKENMSGRFNCKVKATDADRSDEFRHVIYQFVNSSDSAQVNILLYLHSNI